MNFLQQVKKCLHITILFCYLFLNGCVAAIPVAAGLAIAGAATGIYAFINLARDQYPDIDFEKPSPVAVVYKSNFDTTWNAVVDTLMEMKESNAMMDKNSGVIRTNKKNLNDVSWIGKGLGKATFLYELNLTVRKETNGISVATTIPFWEEKMFVAAKEKNIPEGSNTMRHIFYRNLNKRLTPVFVRMPDNPSQDIRYSPLTQEAKPSAETDTEKMIKNGSSSRTGNLRQNGSTVESSDQMSQKTSGYNENLHDGTSTVRIRKNYAEVKVRPEPSTKNTPIGTLKGGDEVAKLDEKNGWVKIRFEDLDENTIEGWISQKLIEKL